ncbi:putative ATP-dependent kinase [Sporobolomyces salmoneus]|uniref:putative ATP-dependent kinase n=1 Tax=Sporobolomyces salmoneus TaxID=183962 RepID=UPI003171A511
MSSFTNRTTLEITTDFILSSLEQRASSNGVKQTALVIGIQGPQGSGKSYLAQQLETSPKLSHLRIANLSLDDLYLPHSRLVELASSNPSNELLSGRGQAGTHDLPLGVEVLSKLRERREVKIPRFEKSLHGGEGDRLPESKWPTVKGGEVDLVLFEGWMLGFKSIPVKEDLSKVYEQAKAEPKSREVKELLGGIDYDEPFILRSKLNDLEKLNEELKEYERLWELVDGWVELRPERLGYVWQWRLEQEHTMKAKNGGIGMTDEQVKTFISRYMPGYELFSSVSKIPKGNESKKHGSLLTVEIGKQRQVVNVEEATC